VWVTRGGRRFKIVPPPKPHLVVGAWLREPHPPCSQVDWTQQRCVAAVQACWMGAWRGEGRNRRGRGGGCTGRNKRSARAKVCVWQFRSWQTQNRIFEFFETGVGVLGHGRGVAAQVAGRSPVPTKCCKATRSLEGGCGPGRPDRPGRCCGRRQGTASAVAAGGQLAQAAGQTRPVSRRCGAQGAPLTAA
jgi:hypothetical protein